VKDNRPVNLDLTTVHFPITAIASILHRVSGVFIFFGLAVLLCMLDQSLESAESFASLKEIMNAFWAKFIVWAVLVGLAYHTLAGVKHLVMDAGVGETLEGGVLGARIVFILAVVAAVLIGAWVW